MQTKDMQRGAMEAGHNGGAQIVGQGKMSADGPGPDVMAANTLEDDAVHSSDGEHLGKIKHIMLDVRSGRIAYAVLSTGGFLGIGDKLLAIPWGALTLDTDNKSFILNVTGAEVKNAPGFDKDHWPAMADPQWATDLHDFYRTPRYWDENRPLPDDATMLPPSDPL
jgi:sporulation protein YlmC with PRC-barrel domain